MRSPPGWPRWNTPAGRHCWPWIYPPPGVARLPAICFSAGNDGKDLAFVPVGHKDYLEFIELNKYLEELRRKKS